MLLDTLDTSSLRFLSRCSGARAAAVAADGGRDPPGRNGHGGRRAGDRHRAEDPPAEDRGRNEDLGGGCRGLSTGPDGRRRGGRRRRSRRPRRSSRTARCPGTPRCSSIGDLWASSPRLAEVAMQSGRHAARTIIRRRQGDATERPFRYRDKGTMATISRFQAIASIGRRAIRLRRLADVACCPSVRA